MRNYVGLVPLPLNPELTAYWTMWGTAATALATAGLIVLATFAWQAALATIRGQQRSDELAAMTAYLRALTALAYIQVATPARFALPSLGDRASDIMRLPLGHKAYVDSLCQEVEVCGAVWRAHHQTSKGPGSAFRDAEQTLIEAQGWWRDLGDGSRSFKDQQFERSATFAEEISTLVLHWQTRTDERRGLEVLMDSECTKFIEESPCRPTKN